MLIQTPLIITDKNGIIMHCNEAAHSTCAAVSFGVSIESLFDAETLDQYRSALSRSVRSFALRAHAFEGYELIFDLSKEASDEIRSIHIRKLTDTPRSAVSYEDVADAFKNATAEQSFAKRRVSELYETLSSALATFGSCRHIELYRLSDILSPFYEHILPNLLSVYGDVISSESGITEESVIYAEPYGLYLSLAAIMSAASALSFDGTVLLKTEDRTDTVSFEVTAFDKNFGNDLTARLGCHCVDLIYAEMLARSSGYTFSKDIDRNDGRVTFTLRVKCSDYYPAYLKSKSANAKTAALGWVLVRQ